MKKILLSLAVIVSLAGYSYIERQQSVSAAHADSTSIFDRTIGRLFNDSDSPTPPAQHTSSPSAGTDPSQTTTSSTSNQTSTTTQPAGKYKDGSYTGSQADAFYGYIKVLAVISNGRLADVKFLEYPNDRRNSVEINQYAMPILSQEAVQAQSANVDIASGATDTSYAFRESLSAALDAAKN